MTYPERILWSRLKDKQLGVWVYAQKLVYGFIADYWCPSCGLCVEIDGKQHLKKAAKVYDANRDRVLARRGIVTMRFPASSVNNNVAAVVAMIRAKVKRRLK